MDINIFINRYSIANKRLKKGLSPDYISNAAEKMEMDKYQESIIREVFDELEQLDPKVVDISAFNVKKLYFDKYRERTAAKADAGDKKPCTHALCDGRGLVVTTNKNKNKPGEFAWRCQCILGQTMDIKIPLWDKKFTKSKGHRLMVDNVYDEKAHSDFLKSKDATDKIRASFIQEKISKIAIGADI